MDKTSLGDRMKQYEHDFRSYVDKTYTIIRLDGKAFHTYTRGLNRPFDYGLIEDMSETAKYLCENIQGAWLGYTQSDEITIVLTPFAKETSTTWFDGNIQKMTSVAASMATAKFNQLRMMRACDTSGGDLREPMLAIYKIEEFKLAMFDARVFTLPSKEEVINNLLWRQRDAIRNSISMAAQSTYSHKQLHKKSTTDMLQMLTEKGIDWNDYPDSAKKGTIIRKYLKTISNENGTSLRSMWVSEGAFDFKVDDNIDKIIPSPGYGYNDGHLNLIPKLDEII
jgi:tRNA(His) 5'-end guanylyltransferase